MNIIKRLAELSIDRANLNELVELSAEAKVVRAEFELHDIPTPEVVTEAVRTLNKEIKLRSEDAIERRLRELDAADAQDRTASERREDRAKERERLAAKIGGVKEPAAV